MKDPKTEEEAIERIMYLKNLKGQAIQLLHELSEIFQEMEIPICPIHADADDLFKEIDLRIDNNRIALCKLREDA